MVRGTLVCVPFVDFSVTGTHTTCAMTLCSTLNWTALQLFVEVANHNFLSSSSPFIGIVYIIYFQVGSLRYLRCCERLSRLLIISWDGYIWSALSLIWYLGILIPHSLSCFLQFNRSKGSASYRTREDTKTQDWQQWFKCIVHDVTKPTNHRPLHIPSSLHLHLISTLLLQSFTRFFVSLSLFFISQYGSKLYLMLRTHEL